MSKKEEKTTETPYENNLGVIALSVDSENNPRDLIEMKKIIMFINLVLQGSYYMRQMISKEHNTYK